MDSSRAFFLVVLSALIGCSDSTEEPTSLPHVLDAGQDDVAPLHDVCFKEHLEEAIALNEQRRPLYSALTGGDSEAISDTLIESEKTSLLFAEPIDEASIPYHQAGVRIVCDEFVPMSGVPAFSDSFDFQPEPLSDYEPVDGDQLSDELEASFADGGFAALSEHTEASLAAIETPRAYHCMLRHMLESLRRIANLAPVHDADAQRAGLESTLTISEDMVRLHLLSLSAAARLDADASPIQATGVPILCHDVPSIPAGP